MLSVKRAMDQNGGIRIDLSGTIDIDDLDTLLGQVEGPTDIYCSQVTQINSVGVRNWVLYFSDPSVMKFKVKLYEVSLTLVEQMSMIHNFTGFAEAVSFMAPYACSKCKLEFSVIMQKSDVLMEAVLVADQPCPNCKGPGVFDEDPTFYLKLSRK